MVALGVKVRWASCDEPAANRGERKITKALKDADVKISSKEIMLLRDTLAELKSDRDTANTVAEGLAGVRRALAKLPGTAKHRLDQLHFGDARGNNE